MGIIIKPIVTEKMTVQGEKLNRYGFIVDREANKLQIKAAVEQMYNVTVADVNTLNYHGKKKSRFTKAGVLRGRPFGCDISIIPTEFTATMVGLIIDVLKT